MGNPTTSRTASTDPGSAIVRPARWGIRVTDPNGQDAWLRGGPVIGRGPIVQFRTRQSAEREAAFMREGMDGDGRDGVLTIVPLQGTER